MQPRIALTTAELVDRCQAVRTSKEPPPAEYVELIEGLAADFRTLLEENPGATSPTGDTARRLRVVGWLMLEVSLKYVQEVLPSWESLPQDEPSARRSAEYDGYIDRIANAARYLAWREYSPRALGALRAQALASSKRDTDAGFARAWLFHREADDLRDLYSSQVSDDEDLTRRYMETLVMLRLAQTGTACRTAEFAIIRQFAADVPSRVAERARINKMFRDLDAGAKYGEQALDVVGEIDSAYGLARAVDEDRLVLETGYRQPGIMTARAYLLMYPVTTLLEQQNRRTWQDQQSWADARAKLLEGFVGAYRRIEDASSGPALTKDFERSIVQLRLNLALICPGFELPSEYSFAPCLQRSVLDAGAVDELSEWLAHRDENGRQRGDANVIGSATMPSYLESLRLVLGDEGWQSYVGWRRTWFVLDRHATENGRRTLVMAALDAASI